MLMSLLLPFERIEIEEEEGQQRRIATAAGPCRLMAGDSRYSPHPGAAGGCWGWGGALVCRLCRYPCLPARRQLAEPRDGVFKQDFSENPDRPFFHKKGKDPAVGLSGTSARERLAEMEVCALGGRILLCFQAESFLIGDSALCSCAEGWPSARQQHY